MTETSREAFKLYSLLALLLFLFVCSRVFTDACEPIDSEAECSRFLAYNDTVYPHKFHQTSQLLAHQRLRTFRLLIDSKCSNNSIILFCGTFYPRCSSSGEANQAAYPCRSVCDEVYNSCASRHGWAQFMNCSRYEVDGNCFIKEEGQVYGTKNPLYPPKIKPPVFPDERP